MCVLAWRVTQAAWGSHVHILKHAADLQAQLQLRHVSANGSWRRRSVLNISKGCCTQIQTFTQFRAVCRILSWIINHHLCTVFLHLVTPELTKAAAMEKFSKIPTRQQPPSASLGIRGGS